ncbi:MAG: cupin domain-containing protein [Blastochloris sp.]|nr:cupin domain-containing protein [Blastochloris sp.]
MKTPKPHISTQEQATKLNLGSSQLLHHLASEHVEGAYSVVEFISAPGEGVGLHLHEHEEELVYLVQGTIEVQLGESKMTAQAGTCALLPRGIPHGYRNIGTTESRLLAVLLPGKLDGFFTALSSELHQDRAHDKPIANLCQSYGIKFIS